MAIGPHSQPSPFPHWPPQPSPSFQLTSQPSPSCPLTQTVTVGQLSVIPTFSLSEHFNCPQWVQISGFLLFFSPGSLTLLEWWEKLECESAALFAIIMCICPLGEHFEELSSYVIVGRDGMGLAASVLLLQAPMTWGWQFLYCYCRLG